MHRKLSFRERPVITVAARLAVAGGRLTYARLALGSVGVAPALVPVAADHLAELTPWSPTRTR